ncbi:hypothetical protein D3C87_1296680 [compost metagenome]
MLLPLADFVFQLFGPGGAVGQAGQRVDQGFLTLFFEVLAQTRGFPLHMRHPFGQVLQAGGHFLLALVALLAVLVHGAQQAFEMVFQNVLEILKVRCFVHAGLQAVDLFAYLRIQRMRCRAAVGMIGAGSLQVALERLEAFIES